MSDLQERAGKIDDSVAINCTEFGLPARWVTIDTFVSIYMTLYNNTQKNV